MTLTPPTDIIQLPPSNAASHAISTSDARNGPKIAPGAPRRHVRRARPQRNRAHLARTHFAAHPATPVPRESPFQCAPEDTRIVRGLKEALAQCPAKERATGQQRGGANGAGQGGNHAAAQSGLTRVRGAECAQGIMRALRDGCAATRAPYWLPHVYTCRHTWYLVEDRRQDGHHAGVSRRGVMPPSTPLGALIERAQTTCHSGRAHSLTP